MYSLFKHQNCWSSKFGMEFILIDRLKFALKLKLSNAWVRIRNKYGFPEREHLECENWRDSVVIPTILKDIRNIPLLYCHQTTNGKSVVWVASWSLTFRRRHGLLVSHTTSCLSRLSWNSNTETGDVTGKDCIQAALRAMWQMYRCTTLTGR